MRPARLAALTLAIGLLTLVASSSGQTTPKAKSKPPKPGAQLVADPNDLPRPGSALSIRTPVQQPAPLKGVRSWTVETKKHRWYPTTLAVSPDGKQLATGGYDGIIRLWSVETGNFERAFVGHDSYVYGLDWSPDGKYLASAGSFNATARVWEAKSGLCVRVLKGHKGYVSHVAWSPDGNKLLTAGGSSGFVTLWDLPTSKQLHTVEYGNPIHSIAFARNGEHICAAAARAGTYIADARDLKTIHAVKETQEDVTAVEFSPDSKRLAAGTAKMTVVYDVETGKSVHKMATAGQAVAWTPAGSLLTAPAGGAVVPYGGTDFAPGKALGVGATRMVVNGPNLFTLVGGQVTHWDLEKNAVVRTVTVGESAHLSWGTNRPLLVGIGTKSPALVDPVAGKHLATLAGHTDVVAVIGWSTTGKLLATGGRDKSARVWESPGGKPLRTLADHGGVVTAVAVAGDGKVATGCADKAVRVWGAKGDQPTQSLAGHRNTVTAVAWSRDNRTLASGSTDRDVILWSADTGKRLRTLEHPSEVQCLAFSPDGSKLAVGSVDDRLRVYQVSTGKQLHEWEKGGSPQNVSAVVWSADGQFVLAGRGNHTLQYWSLKANRDVQNIGSMAPLTGVAVPADGKTLVGASLDRSVRFWEGTSGRLRMTLVAEAGQVAAIGADGNYRCPPDIESELVAVVQTDKGQETVTLKELATKYGFRNSPGAVK
jgi:WD40 repeat protein